VSVVVDRERRNKIYAIIRESRKVFPKAEEQARRKKWVRARLFMTFRGIKEVKVRMDGARNVTTARSLPGLEL